MEYADRILDSSFSCYTLDCLDYNLLCLLVGIELGLVHNLVDIGCGICTSLVLKAFNESVTSFVSRETRELLELFTLLELHLLEFFLFHSEKSFLVFYTLLVLFYLLTATSEFFLTLVKAYLALFQTVLALLNLLIALLDFLFQFALLVNELLLYFEELLFFKYVSLLLGGIYHLLIFTCDNISENQVAYKCTDYKCSYGYYYIDHIVIFKLINNILKRPANRVLKW